MTTDTTDELATRVGVSVRTLRRQLAALIEVGFLERYGEVLRRPQPEGESADLDLPVEQPQRVTLTVAGTPVDNHQGSAAGADTNAGSADTNAGSYYLTPEDLTPEASPPSSRSARHLSERAGQATSGRKRPEGGIYSTPGISEVRDILETNRQWRYGERKVWQARILTVVAPHLEAGMTPGSVAHALVVRAEVEIDEALQLMQSPLAAVAAGLKALAIDIRLGQACRDCGRDAPEADQSALVAGRCDWCTDDRVTGPVDPAEPEIPAAALEEVRRHLSPSPSPRGSASPEPISSDEGALTEPPNGPARGQEPIESTVLAEDSLSDRPCARTSIPDFVPTAVGVNCRHRHVTHSSQRLHPLRRPFARASQASAGGAECPDRCLARPP